MEYFLIGTLSLLISLLAFFSGFGLGTILMPVFALFFPLPTAVTFTAVIHFVNNVFKSFLVGAFTTKQVFLRFVIPAAIASAIGAYFLGFFSQIPTLFSYQLSSITLHISILGVLVGITVIGASIFELHSRFAHLAFHAKYLPIGGMISGFLGGLSGNQGILRAAFLIKSDLNVKQFIGTNVLCSLVVDFMRITVYGIQIYKRQFQLPKEGVAILVIGVSASLIGAYIGYKLLNKLTSHMLQLIVGYMLLLLGVAILLGAGALS